MGGDFYIAGLRDGRPPPHLEGLLLYWFCGRAGRTRTADTRSRKACNWPECSPTLFARVHCDVNVMARWHRRDPSPGPTCGLLTFHIGELLGDFSIHHAKDVNATHMGGCRQVFL